MQNNLTQKSFQHPDFDTLLLQRKGLNLQATFSLDELDQSDRIDLERSLPSRDVNQSLEQFSHLLLLGHGGRQFWTSARIDLGDEFDRLENPLDSYVTRLVDVAMTQSSKVQHYCILYPGDPLAMDLPALGRKAGWQDDSPFAVGVHQKWGPWFAYRALVLIQTTLTVQTPKSTMRVCSDCDGKPCIEACPAQALSAGSLNLSVCLAYRQQPHSRCRHQCLARMACPVGVKHRYSQEQMRYHYDQSLKMIMKNCRSLVISGS